MKRKKATTTKKTVTKPKGELLGLKSALDQLSDRARLRAAYDDVNNLMAKHGINHYVVAMLGEGQSAAQSIHGDGIEVSHLVTILNSSIQAKIQTQIGV